MITCKIKREGNKTSFSVNGKPSTKKAVVEYAKSFSIQIDNLCQFLPQDKVVEFAAMTPVELLKSTQRAVGSQEMIDMHENLKELGQKHKEIQARQASDQDTLGNLEGRQRMQEADVERMRERESIKERVRLMEAARPFARYREARLRHKEAKEKRKEHASALKKLEEEVEPSLRAVNEKQRYQQQIDIVVKERRQAIENADRSANALDKEVGALAQRGEEFVKERDTNINNGRADKKEIARLEGNVSRIKKQMGEEPPSLDISSCNEQIVCDLSIAHSVVRWLIINSVSKNGRQRASGKRFWIFRKARSRRPGEAKRGASESERPSRNWLILSLKLDSRTKSSSRFPETLPNFGSGSKPIRKSLRNRFLGLLWWSARSQIHDSWI